MVFSKQEYWSGLPFPSPVDHILSDISTMACPSWVAPQGMAWFHWVRQGCGPSVIRLTSFLWIWFQCVFLLMPSCNTYHLTWVSLTLDKGYLVTATPPDLECGVAPLAPPGPAQPPPLGRVVAPLTCHPWPRGWVSSSQMWVFNAEVMLTCIYALYSASNSLKCTRSFSNYSADQYKCDPLSLYLMGTR